MSLFYTIEHFCIFIIFGTQGCLVTVFPSGGSPEPCLSCKEALLHTIHNFMCFHEHIMHGLIGQSVVKVALTHS